jgi:uncharacterized repeat protein (TIGR04138 family)
MPTTSKLAATRLRYHPHAYQFVFAALRYTQDSLGRAPCRDREEETEEQHISGQELLDGIREFGTKQFGLLATTVFRHWNVRNTVDFGRIVFDLVERGEMRKTDRDQMDDFVDYYDFEDVFDQQYQINTAKAFRR